MPGVINAAPRTKVWTNANFTASAAVDCGQLVLQLTPDDPQCAHTWTITIGSVTLPAITTASVTQILTDLNTYTGGTPTAQVTHTIDCNGTVQSVTQTVTLPTGIFIGADGQVRTAATALTAYYTGAAQPLLPGGLLTGRDVFVAGTLQFDKDYRFYACNLQMRSCAAIEVPEIQGAVRELEFNQGARVFTGNGCDLWRGIELSGNVRLIVDQVSQIRDAVFAVNLVMSPSGLGPRLALNTAEFINNFVGINMVRAAGGAVMTPVFERFSGNGFVMQNIPIKNLCAGNVAYFNQYRPSGASFDNTTGYAGLHAREAVLILPASIAADNVFSGTSNGMALFDVGTPAAAPITRCRFLNMTDAVVAHGYRGNGIAMIDANGGPDVVFQDGNGTQLPNFSGCPKGIFVEAGVPDTYINSRRNTMNAVKIGYDLLVGENLGLLNGQRSYLFRNNITALQTGINYYQRKDVKSHLFIEENNITINTKGGRGMLFQHAGPGAANNLHDILVFISGVTVNLGVSGIEMHNMRGMAVRDCGVTVTPNPPLSALVRGMALYNCRNMFLRQNWLSGQYPTIGGDLTEGIYVEAGGGNGINKNNTFDLFRGLRFKGTTPATISCNSMSNEDIGLYYDTDAVTGVQIYEGNCWGTWFGTFAAFFNNPPPGAILANLYRVPIACILAPCQSPPSALISPLPWFDYAGINFCADCPSDEPPPGAEEFTAFDEQVVAEGLEYPPYSEAKTWNARRYVYGKLKNYPDLATSNSVAQEFLNENASTSLGLLGEFSWQSYHDLQLPADIQASWDNDRHWAYQLTQEIAEIDAALANSPTSSEEVALLIERGTKLENYENAEANNAQRLSDFLGQRASDATGLASQASAISPTQDYDFNEKDLLQIYLNTVMQGFSPDETQEELIYSIANQCPITGGAPVYWARAWYFGLTGEEIDFEEACAEERAPAEIDANTGDGWLVYPNPATDVVTVRNTRHSFSANSTVRLLTPVGQLVREITVPDGNEYIIVQLRSLPPGVYILSVSAPGERVQSRKLIVR